MQIRLEHVLNFLHDEGIDDPIKVKTFSEDEFEVAINEPWQDDARFRCGITGKYNEDGEFLVLFNSF